LQGEGVYARLHEKRLQSIVLDWSLLVGGGGGIRTHGGASTTTVFETAPIGRSGTPPEVITLRLKDTRAPRKKVLNAKTQVFSYSFVSSC
jgi:hypothetical protein